MNVLVRVPPNFEDIGILTDRVDARWSVISTLSQDQIRLTGSFQNVLDAQNYALRFIGPESITILGSLPECQQLFQDTSLNNYFEDVFNVIYYIDSKGSFVVKGRKEDNEYFITTLKHFQNAAKSSSQLTPLKEVALSVMCQKFNVNLSKLLPSDPLKVCLLNHFTYRLGKVDGNGCLQDKDLKTIMPNVDTTVNSFVEVYRHGHRSDARSLSSSRYRNRTLATRTNDTHSTSPKRGTGVGAKPLFTEISSASACEATTTSPQATLRPVVLDGTNIAFAHGKQQKFSPQGIKLALDFFFKRGHTNVLVLVPRHFRAVGGELFDELEHSGHLVYTPSRVVNAERQAPYDDRVILQLAHSTDGVVVSNDQFRDLYKEHPEFRALIEKRLLPYVMAGDTFLIPEDPHGQRGASLSNCLSYPSENPAL